VNERDYTGEATRAVLQAARIEPDFSGWLAQVLATVAGQLGSSAALTAGRPGSWEASHLRQLLAGTVGEADEYLPDPMRKITDETARQILEDARWDSRTYQQIGAEYGVSATTVSRIAKGKIWGWLQ
jgi:hypothetical protein